MKIACLPMYDWPELQSANDAFWELLRDRLAAKGIASPQKLTHGKNGESHWLSPDLIFGQTCGFPLATELTGKVTYLATPVYAVEGCSEARYSSAIVTHKESGLDPDNLRGAKFAYNSKMSWSGYRTMMLEFGGLEEYFGTMVESGGHRQSARIVAAGIADVAALDAVCWHILQRHEPQTADRLKVIGWSALQPALPFITSIHTPPQVVEELRLCLSDVLAAVEMRQISDLLPLKGCEVLDPDSYSPMGETR